MLELYVGVGGQGLKKVPTRELLIMRGNVWEISQVV